ncbi:MAG: hypothetical protein AAEJ04_07460 [Planctomycetota bacterium]
MESIECPHCGAQVPPQRICCAGCGSDLETGWLDPQEIDYSSIELPEQDLPSKSDSERTNALRRSVGVLLILFIGAPLSFLLLENIPQVLAAWLLLGLLLGIQRSRN